MLEKLATDKPLSLLGHWVGYEENEMFCTWPLDRSSQNFFANNISDLYLIYTVRKGVFKLILFSWRAVTLRMIIIFIDTPQ